MDWDNLGFIKASKYRRKVLEELDKSHLSPLELSRLLKLPSPHISKILKEMVSIEAIECLTPKLRKGKIFGITNKGKLLLQKINK